MEHPPVEGDMAASDAAAIEKARVRSKRGAKQDSVEVLRSMDSHVCCLRQSSVEVPLRAGDEPESMSLYDCK